MTTTQNGWQLSDFNTPGWEDLEPREGARVFFSYGIGCGEALGRLVRQEVTRWGTHWVVAMDDGTQTTTSGNFRGRAIAYPYRPDTGERAHEEPVIRHETKGIGCYVIRIALDARGLPS